MIDENQLELPQQTEARHEFRLRHSIQTARVIIPFPRPACACA
jgi:hypothetical protein